MIQSPRCNDRAHAPSRRRLWLHLTGTLLCAVLLGGLLLQPRLSGEARAQQEAADERMETAAPGVEAADTVRDTAAEVVAEEQAQATSWQQRIDDAFGSINGRIAPVLFFDITFGAFSHQVHDKHTDALVFDADADGQPTPRMQTSRVPLIVAVLLLGGVFFTFRYGFVNLRMFGHSLSVLRGKYDNPNDHGEISHFQALTAALSATVGLGNIAGVAIAISMGGPGAVFWMWVVAIFGMSSKFSCCTLAQMYRRIQPEGGKDEHVLGGPMIYLDRGIRETIPGPLGLGLGKTLAITFAVFAILGSLGGGNLFQGNQTFAIAGDVILRVPVVNEAELLQRIDTGDTAAVEELSLARAAASAETEERRRSYAWVGGLVLAVLVGLVVVGGIKRIGEVTSKLVPVMCVFYCGVCLVIVGSNIPAVPAMFAEIFAGAFTGKAAAWGGIVGVLVMGVTRGAFSNEAGLGSAAIAHSAARTNEPVREGVVALMEPFIDTIIVCTMTALAILITRSHMADSAGGFSNEGVGITASAFSQLAGWLPYLLTLAVFTFAYSTMITWSYYGERASEYLFGKAGIWPYRIVFLAFVAISPLLSLANVVDFTDLLILSMAYPNIMGMIILSPKVARATKDYIRRLKSGEVKTYEELRKMEEGEPSI